MKGVSDAVFIALFAVLLVIAFLVYIVYAPLGY